MHPAVGKKSYFDVCACTVYCDSQDGQRKEQKEQMVQHSQTRLQKEKLPSEEKQTTQQQQQGREQKRKQDSEYGQIMTIHRRLN